MPSGNNFFLSFLGGITDFSLLSMPFFSLEPPSIGCQLKVMDMKVFHFRNWRRGGENVSRKRTTIFNVKSRWQRSLATKFLNELSVRPWRATRSSPATAELIKGGSEVVKLLPISKGAFTGTARDNAPPTFKLTLLRPCGAVKNPWHTWNSAKSDKTLILQ